MPWFVTNVCKFAASDRNNLKMFCHLAPINVNLSHKKCCVVVIAWCCCENMLWEAMPHAAYHCLSVFVLV